VPATCVIGLQWGDEAKGKIVDLLTEQHDIVVRYQGGANAGHTVSGIFSPHVRCVVANGVVIYPPALIEEIDSLSSQGVKVGNNLLLSDRAHVIFPWHFAEDREMNSQCGDEAIGTTLRGIGPCYRDKVGRSLAVRVGDLYRSDFPQQVARIVEVKRRMLACLNGKAEPIELDPAAIAQEYQRYAQRLRPYVTDTTSFLLQEVEAGKRVLFEGAQGTLLDVDHGTFPYVTSSNSSGVGVSAGSGVPGRYVSRVVGVVKAYTTRVGGGPFPTEQDNEIGQRIRDRGNEYGTVTRRPRRCGWFDAVAARYAARVSGVDVLAVMLLDVFSGLPELMICTAYELAGRRITEFPSHVDDLRRVKPIYETLPGWQEDISAARRLEELPPAARRYLERISRLVGCPVGVVSVGPDRSQTILVESAFGAKAP